MKKRRTKPLSSGKLRIIAGQWRGRTLSVPDVEGLRPTPDRVRETLFNWLQGDIQGRTCWDLFAGTGALGLEALSRGAGSCVFFEASQIAAEGIKQHLHTLSTDSGQVVRGILPETLEKFAATPDLIFMDAPYRKSLTEPCIASLSKLEAYANTSLYIETAVDEPCPTAYIVGKSLHREKHFGQIRSQLFVPL